MPAPETGFMITDRFKKLGFTYADRFRIAARLEKEGGARPGEYVIDAAYRVAKMMKAEEEAKAQAAEATEPTDEAAPEPASKEAQTETPSRDDELVEINLTMKLPRREVRELFAKAA